ncbi:MAG: hypothetical protein Alpg2KO_02750 [Alphaproteobacteria bacterium]
MMDRYIEAPAEYTLTGASVFIAGGISNCPDWQAPLCKRIGEQTGLTMLNPRRADFDISRSEESRIQIEWEHQALRDATGILFWFPRQTLCPITLLELGAALQWDKPLWIGCDPDYARIFDVEMQTRLQLGPDHPIHLSLEDLTAAVIADAPRLQAQHAA